jgi:hypothetical protein
MNMKKYTLILTVALAFAGAANAQFHMEGFEDVLLDSGQVMNGKKGEKAFVVPSSGSPFQMKMPILYDTSWGGNWAGGWAISKQIDGSTGPSDFSKHLYCAKPGFGSEKNSKGEYIGKGFAVGMNGSYIKLDMQLIPKNVGRGMMSLEIANSTYAYNSMKNGDNFAKKFGGSTGNDADSFVLKINFFVDTLKVGTKRVILADYRFADNSKDFILSSWERVIVPNYFPEGAPDSITFELESSDNGQFGMNTPGFFCLDRVLIAQWGSVKNINSLQAKLYPNPTKDILEIQTQHPAIAVEVLDATGRTVLTQACDSRNNLLNASRLSLGSYQVKVKTAVGQETATFVKQ